MITLTEPQSKLLHLLRQRAATQEVVNQLGWSRQQLHAVLKQLTRVGLLRSEGELPTGARASVFPSADALELWSAVMTQDRIGCDDATATRVRRDLTRVGMLRPDDRPQWSGHTIRRVEWRRDGGSWVVQGLLIPRSDGRNWSHATPDHRAVTVSWGAERPFCWVDYRDLIVTTGCIPSPLVDSLPLDEQVGLTMSVAWVLESRALLDAEALGSPILGGHDG